MDILSKEDLLFSEAIGSVIGSKEKQNEDEKQNIYNLLQLQQPKHLLPETNRKKDARIVESQMLVLSESKDRLRGVNNAYSLCEAFKSITGDNELIYRRHNKKVDLLQYRLNSIDAIKTSPEECQNFIALPGRELLEDHKIIDKIDTYESEVPEELQQGVICIGDNTYRGKDTKAYITIDKEFKNLALAATPASATSTSAFFHVNFLNQFRIFISLGAADWEARYTAPFGVMSAGDLLASWVAHDVLHMRQLVELHRAYIVHLAEPYNTEYAGPW
jgi:hypothetical protein